MKSGDRVGEYVLARKIGAGGFGEVWKAEHAGLAGKFVAVKIPTDPDYVRRPRASGIPQHRLDHPSIVRTLTLNASHDPPYPVMEHVPRRSLREALRSETVLPLARAAGIASEPLEATESSGCYLSNPYFARVESGQAQKARGAR